MVAFHHVHHVRPVDIVILQFAAISPKTCFGWIFGTKIKMRLKGIIKEDTVRYALVQADIKRDTAVKRVLVPCKRVGIGIPVF